MNFEHKNIIIAGLPASFAELNEGGIPAVFYPANGFPLGTYSEFLRPLTTKYQLAGLSLRACWPEAGKAPKEFDWVNYADDLIEFLEKQYRQPVTVIGHSQGATAAVIAAAKRPELFNRLIVIEPATVSDKLALMLNISPYFLKKLHEPIKGALRKQQYWNSRSEFFEYIRQQRVYKRISDKVLEDFSTYGLKATQNGKLQLVFSPEWEAANYAKAIKIWKYIKKVSTPVYLLAGKPSMFFASVTREKWKQMAPETIFDERWEYGHLLPLEAPELCAEIILINP